MKVEEFIKQHNHINYCEAAISPEGDIEYCIPSHTEKFISISGYSKEELYKKMPEYADPLRWLVCLTGYVSVWYEFGIFCNRLTDKQEEAIEKLKEGGVLSSLFELSKTDELQRCEYLKNLYKDSQAGIN